MIECKLKEPELITNRPAPQFYVKDTLIAWDEPSIKHPYGLVKIGPLIGEYEQDWTDYPHRFSNTGGAAYVGWRTLSGIKAERAILWLFTDLVTFYRIHPNLVDYEFHKIHEFRSAIESAYKSMD